MKVNLNIVEKLVGFELPPVDELVDRVNSQLGRVEEVVDLGAKYGDAKIVKVVECEKHPNADKLSVCKVDNGSGELIQVVCGAPNVHADMWAIWLPPGSTVPATFDDEEPFVLGARELRGVMSQGMLAAEDELGIGTNHSGIVEVAKRDIAEGQELKPGANFAKVFGLDGHTISIENKMFTHRPDLFGQFGVAREISAILQPLSTEDKMIDNRYVNDDWYWSYPEFAPASVQELEVFNDTPENCPRFMAVAIRDIAVGESPLWLKCQLMAMGAKPINNIVDLTNYLMLMTAQPSHAYDYDKLTGHKIGVRMAKNGEELKLINGKSYTLSEDDIVIVDGNGVIGLGGVMGGLDSEVTADTKNIVLEVANFDMYTIRKTSMRHGLFTDAVTRFNKGQSVLQANRIMKRLIELMPGAQASNVYDLPDKSSELSEVSVHGEILIDADFINKRLGTTFTLNQIGNILRASNFASYPTPDNDQVLSVTAPYWRTDIELREDIVEEVGRLYGYDRLPRELPVRNSAPATKNNARETKKLVRESLVRLGANEVLSYSFVHENTLKKADQDTSQAFRLSNALSPDLQYYRLSVLPSLLDKVHMNIKAGHDEFALFEIGKGHNKKYHLADDEGLPKEINFIDIVYASKQPKDGAPYYQMRRLVDQLASDLGTSLMYKPADAGLDFPVTAPFDLSRSAMIETRSGVFIGILGELKQSVIRGFKLPTYVASASLDLEGLLVARSAVRQNYQPLNKYPSVFYDVSLKMAHSSSYSQILSKIESITENSDLDTSIRPVSIYQPDNDRSVKTITFKLAFSHQDRTLSDDEVRPILQKIEQISIS